MGELIRSNDWSQTILGAPEEWSPALQSALSICINSGFPIAIYWGEKFTLLYNDAWSSIPGEKHPWALGMPGQTVWPEIWHLIEEQFTNVLSNEDSIRSPDTLLPMQRHGYMEECYFDYTLSPIRESNGRVGGIFNAVIETSYRVINERRNGVLHQLSQQINKARSKEEGYKVNAKVVREAKKDIPFCLLYTYNEINEITLVEAIGVDAENAALIQWPVAEVLKKGSIEHIACIEDYFQQTIESFWPEPCKEALIIPLKHSEGTITGFMVSGINPRKALDTEYRNFLETVAVHIGTAIANGATYQKQELVKEQLVQREEELKAILAQQQKLVTLVNNSIELMSVLELDGRNSYLNKAGMEMLGFDNFEQVLTTPISQLHEPEDIAFVEANVLPGVMNNGRWSGQMNVRHIKTGDVFPVYNNTIRIDDPETGQPLAIGAVMRDMRPELMAQQALIESERKFRNLVMQAPVGICIVKGDAFIVEVVNENFLELVGRKRSELENRPYWESLKEAAPYYAHFMEGVKKTGIRHVGKEAELTLLRNGKEELLYVSFVYEPIIEPDDTVERVMILGIEVTQQVMARKKIEESEKELQQRVIERTAELEKKNSELEQYAHVSSHDLQEPLRKIHMFTEMIREADFHQLSDASKTRFEKIQEASRRMSATLSDLLNFTSLNHQLQQEAVDLNQVIKTVTSDLEHVIAQKEATLNIENLPVVNAVPLQMHQLFYNLVNNGLKFSKQGVAPVIHISFFSFVASLQSGWPLLQPGKTYYEIVVKDNGIGFSQEYAEKIFGLFQRLHSKQQYSGTGIGLALCRKVVTNHGGDIRAVSAPGEGAGFHLVLPA